MDRLNLKKGLLFFVGLLCIAFAVLWFSANAKAADSDIAFRIQGSGINLPNGQNYITLTVGDLRALPQVTYTYTGYNHWPSLQVFKNASGPTLKSILEKAGLKDTAKLIKIKTSSGNVYNHYTVKELLEDERYYYPDGETGDLTSWPPIRSEEGKTKVETIIGLSSGVYGKLLYGQRWPLEPTACKGEQIEAVIPYKNNVDAPTIIEVSAEEPTKWQAPHADIPSGWVVSGTKVKLQHRDGTPYGALVYYTLDGSEPTVKSNIANISYPYFQPDLNAPIPIYSDVTIKTRTIGIGHYDSDVATYSYKLGKLAFKIQGAGLETAKNYAVEALKEMTPVEQAYKTSDNGEVVDLNGKGVLLGTFLDDLSAASTWKVKFIDTAGTEYDGGTVQDIKNQKCMLAYQVNGSGVADVLGENTSYIQILRNYNTVTNIDNRLKNIQTIKLVNVDDKITINSVKLLDNTDKEVSSIAPGGSYRIEANLLNKTGAKMDAFLVINVRNGSKANDLEGGNTIGYAAIRSVIPISGNIATAEFTMPSNLSGKAYVDIYVWDNYKDHNSLGADYHGLSFDIK